MQSNHFLYRNHTPNHISLALSQPMARNQTARDSPYAPNPATIIPGVGILPPGDTVRMI